MWNAMRAACGLAVALVSADSAWIEEKGTIHRTFQLGHPSAARRIQVDNLSGSIRVVGYEGREVEVTVEERVRAESKEKIAQARREVKLDISQQDNTVRLYVDGPFRCKCADGSISFRGWRHYGYQVSYEFQIKAPRDAGIFLKTVNEGEIKVEGVWGDYELENINGGIELLEASGSGRAYALNGRLKVVFRKNPQGESMFGSLNGPVDLLFQPDLSADLRIKTFSGKVYSDFPVTALPVRPAAGERRDGKFVYKADRFSGVRVGNGGPEITLDGFNGDIRILRREK
jgi:hypothetical protein